MMWLIEISAYGRTGSFSGFRKPGGAKYKIFVQKQRAQSFIKVAINCKIPSH